MYRLVIINLDTSSLCPSTDFSEGKDYGVIGEYCYYLISKFCEFTGVQ